VWARMKRLHRVWRRPGPSEQICKRYGATGDLLDQPILADLPGGRVSVEDRRTVWPLCYKATAR